MQMSLQVIRPTRLAIAVIALATLSCSDLTAPTTDGASNARRALLPPARPYFSLDPAQLRPAFGPQTVTRDKGAPVTVSFTIAGYGPNAVLHVLNGDANGGNRVSSAEITLDGTSIVSPSSFSQQVASFDDTLTLGNPSTLAVRLASKPGSRITLSINAQIAMAGSATPAGGTVQLLGTQVSVVVPAGALTTATTLTATPAAPPTPDVVPGTSIDLGPSGTTFLHPVTLSIGYDPAGLPRGVKPGYLHLKWWNVDHWELLPGNAVDVAHASVSATTTHLGTFALLPDAVEFCPSDPTSESDFQTAIGDTPVDGTLWVCDGNFTVAGAVSKGMTIRAEHPGLATLTQVATAATTDAVLLVSGIASGTVNVMDMNVVFVTHGLRTLDFDQLSVTGSTFTGTNLNNNGSGVLLDLTLTPPNHVLFDHDTFTGGTTGLVQSQPINIETYNSNFHDFGYMALVYSTASGTSNPVPAGGTPIRRSGRVEHNTFSNCGTTSGACIALEESGADTVRFNTITINSGTVADGILINRPGATLATPAVITDNVIQGHAPIGDPHVASSWGLWAAIRNYGGVAGVVDDIERNQINTAFIGFDIRTPWGIASAINAVDNTVTNTLVVMNYQGSGSIAAHRNDFTNYTYPIVANAGFVPLNPAVPSNAVPGSLTCNWWGSAAGPVGVLAGVPLTSYTPYSTVPIAGVPSVTCDPNAIPTTIRACATPSGSGIPTVPTVLQAYNSVPSGGTVLVCDGSFVVNNVTIAKPVTITAEGPGMPTLDADGGNRIFGVVNVPTGTVTISKLRFTGGVNGQVAVNQNGATTNITDNEFHPPQTNPYNVQPQGYKWGVNIIGTGIVTVNIDHNAFIGGDAGIDPGPTPGAVVNITRNTFTGQVSGPININTNVDATYDIENNSFEDCSNNACVQTNRHARIVNNTFRVNIERPLYEAIFLQIQNGDLSPSTVTDNTILGIGNNATARDVTTTYPLWSSAINVWAGVVDVSRNHITNAFRGIGSANGATVTASDNVIQTTYAPLAGGMGAGNLLTANWNDLSDYFTGVGNPAALNLGALNIRCNWWGQPGGPASMDPTVPSAAFTPFAAAPVVGQAHAGCTP
jgi:hypothetical protein